MKSMQPYRQVKVQYGVLHSSTIFFSILEWTIYYFFLEGTEICSYEATYRHYINYDKTALFGRLQAKIERMND
jgi:hypothetical protein